MDTLKKMFYVKLKGCESLLLYDQLEIKPFGLSQLQDVKNEPADVQQLFAIKEEVPWSSSLTGQDPGPLKIKEEKEEQWTTQEGEQFYAQGETDTSRLNASVKSEDDEAEPQFSQRLQIKTENNRETEPPTCCLATETKTEPKDCKGLEPGRNPSPNSNSQPHLDKDASETSDDDKNEASPVSESQREDIHDDWKVKLVGKTAKGSFRCSVCAKQFIYKQSFQNHMMRHLEKDSSSSLVDESLREKQNGNLQKKGHTAGKRCPCTVCGKTFESKGKLKYHRMSHAGKKQFRCSDCGKEFRYKGGLRDHMMLHTGKKPFICSDCGKTFRFNYALKEHMMSHTGEKPFICSYCDKKFIKKWRLTVHMKLHTGDKPFTCSDCGKKFINKGLLKDHMMIHTGEKPFICRGCGKTFRSKSKLKDHMMIHTGEKPFICSDCGQTFRYRGRLKAHMTIHTGETPFVCSNCGKTFRSKGGLQYHMMIHTGQKPFECDKCGKGFRNNFQLKVHLKCRTTEKQFVINEVKHSAF